MATATTTTDRTSAISHCVTDRAAKDDYEFLRARCQLGAWVVLACISLFAIADVRLAHGGGPVMHLIRVVQFTVMGGSLWLIHGRVSRRQLTVVAVAFVGIVYVTTALSAYLRHDLRTQLVTDLALAFGTATTLPWGVGPQLVSAMIAGLSAILGTYLVDGNLASITAHIVAAVVVALTASIYITYQLQRYRRERDHAEEALRQSEERFRSLIEHGADVITIVGADGVIRYESSSVERILGHSPEERIGRHASQCIHPDDLARLPWDGVSQQDVATFECRARRRDGSWCDVEAVGTNLLAHPAVQGFVFNWREITERKRADEERAFHMRELAEARDQALASTRAKSAFLANTSHEIRTPMNVIIGMTDMALDQEIAPEARECMIRVRAAALALLGIINDILDHSKIEAGKMKLELVDLDLRATAKEVAALLGRSAAEKGLVLECRLAPDLPERLRGDPGRVRQVLTNLAGNAIKFTNAGTVTIDLSVRRQSATHAAIRLAVSDTGIGIPREHQAAVFESFTQVDGGSTRTSGGTGLGLTIVRQLVELMGGRIRLESEPGKGSTFSIDLAFEKAPSDEAERRCAVNA